MSEENTRKSEKRPKAANHWVQSIRHTLGLVKSLILLTAKAGIFLVWLTYKIAPYSLTGVGAVAALHNYGYINFYEISQEQVEKIPVVQWYRGWTAWQQAQAIEASTSKAESDDLMLSMRAQYSREELENIVKVSARKFGVPEQISLAFVDHESNWNPTAFRHEQHHMNHPTCKHLRNFEQRRLCAGSHGLFQIMFSVWKNQCKLNSFAELYDPRVNAACGNYILSRIIDQTGNIKQLDERLNAMMKAYNGVNMPPKYAHAVMASMGRRMFADVVPREERQDVLISSLDIPWEPPVRVAEMVADAVIGEPNSPRQLAQYRPLPHETPPDEVESGDEKEKGGILDWLF